MGATTARSGAACSILCAVLERNEIRYEIKDNKDIACFVNGGEGDISLLFRIDSSKMLVTLYSPLGEPVPFFCAGDVSLAVCMINNSLSDGTFCYDISDRLIYFRMTSSFYNSGANPFMFEYMLCAAAEAVDKYRPVLKKLMLCSVS